jgi:Sulfatase-modifying factor enzyme 1
MRRTGATCFAVLGLLTTLPACDDCSGSHPETLDAAPSASSSPEPTESVAEPPAPTAEPARRCPEDMVLVKQHLCVDRYEAQLVDAATGQLLSPYYPVRKDYSWFLKAIHDRSKQHFDSGGTGLGRTLPFPPFPTWQKSGELEPVAQSREGVEPNGYVNMNVAKSACERAGKRLCTLEEWRTACRGKAGRKFPYGDTYEAGKCNVFREDSPGRILFDNASLGMLDPRMNLVEAKGRPLYRKTGATSSCRSEWDEPIYDMVGNLDEWVDDPKGTFVGGFYSRSTKAGCDTIVTAHVPGYQDYSIGVRCCRDAME